MKRGLLGAWVAALAGACWCTRYVHPLLNPLSLEVSLRDDWAQHTLGWLFFRNQSFELPVGKLRNFLHPLGTTIGYMDAIPLLAVPLRPWSAWLPQDFQYLGLWILFCSASLAFVSARIASALTPNWEQQALVGLLVAMSPALIARIVHPALCGHMFIVAALALNLRRIDSARAARRSMLAALAIVFAGSATHPYFAVMPLALLIGLPIRARRQLGLPLTIAALLGMLATALGLLTLLGYIGGGMKDTLWGFGVYSANLNTLFNSMGNSRLLPGLPNTRHQHEGYCYLGAGVLFSIGTALSLMLVPKLRSRVQNMPWRRALWPLVAALACAVFALASPVRWGEHELLHIGLYKKIAYVTDSFRSSGRFIWPLGYWITLAAALTVVRALSTRRWLLTLFLTTAVGLQAYDLTLDVAVGRFAQTRAHVYSAPQWQLAEQDYKHLVLFPAQVRNTCKPYKDSYVNELAYLAYRHRWTFNSGYAARYPDAQEKACSELKAQLRAGELRADEIYVVNKREVRRLRDKGATCGALDELLVCVQSNGGALASYLADHP